MTDRVMRNLSVGEKDDPWTKIYQERISNTVKAPQLRDGMKEYFNYVHDLKNRFPRIRNLIEKTEIEYQHGIEREERNLFIAPFKKALDETVQKLNLEEVSKQVELQEKYKGEIKIVNLEIEKLQKKRKELDDKWKVDSIALKKRHNEYARVVAEPVWEDLTRAHEQFALENFDRCIDRRKNAIQKVLDNYNWKKPPKSPVIKRDDE